MVIHLTSAAHKEALRHVLAAVATSAGKLQLFKQMYVFALHLTVTDKVKCRSQTGKSRTDDVCRFFIDVLRLFGMCKRFVSSCRIIQKMVLRFFSEPRKLFASLGLFLFCNHIVE